MIPACLGHEGLPLVYRDGNGTGSMSTIDIALLRDRPSYLNGVISLGDRHKSKLGLFPREALEHMSQEGQVLIACDDDMLAGYLLFRASRRHPRRATIIHLCVEPDRRGQGIARLLVDELKRLTHDLAGIRLKCRRDYDENRLWPRLGFQLLDEVPGKSRERTPLNIWWFENESPLLAAISKSISERSIVVALDANVVFDLDSEEVASVESRALESDWLLDLIHPFVTPELNAEISRREDAAERERSRESAGRFMVLQGDPNKFTAGCRALTDILGPPRDDSEASDIRQIAWASAGRAEYFVTRDQRLLQASRQIAEHLGIAVVRPSELIGDFDEITNAAAYQPGRFDGSRLNMRAVGAREEARLTELYLDFPAGEKKSKFVQTLRRAFTAEPGTVSEISGPDQQSYILVQVVRAGGMTLIPILRASNNNLSPTVIRQLLTSMGFQQAGSIIHVTEDHLSPMVQEALADARFIRTDSGWKKPCIRYVGAAIEVARLVESSYPSFGFDLFSAARRPQDSAGLVSLERTLSPAKFTDLSMPCYIIPILPAWAAQLFDFSLAEQDLFGFPPELGFRLENVYYRAARGTLTAPARILWYVSKKGTYEGAGAIRAASYLDETIVGTAKRLFSQFKRLGVYRWEDVRQISESEVMALRFSGTELLEYPISWSVLQGALQAQTGKGNQIQGPVQITEHLFFELYCRATGTSPPSDTP
jgi:GNAT superfamily N-acetyltransferase